MMEINDITGDVLDAAIKVHQRLGPGLLESVYEKVLTIEIEKRGHKVECQKSLPIRYDGHVIADAFRMDMLVDGLVVVELKSTPQMLPVYFKQLRTYLVLSGLQVGLLINFGMSTLKEGFKRIVNHYDVENSAASAYSARGVMSHAENAENAEGVGEGCGRAAGAIALTNNSAVSALSARGTMSHAEDAENAEGVGEGCGKAAGAIALTNNSAVSAYSARDLSHAEDAENAEGTGVCRKAAGAATFENNSAASALSARGTMSHAENAESVGEGCGRAAIAAALTT